MVKMIKKSGTSSGSLSHDSSRSVPLKGLSGDNRVLAWSIIKWDFHAPTISFRTARINHSKSFEIIRNHSNFEPIGLVIVGFIAQFASNWDLFLNSNYGVLLVSFSITSIHKRYNFFRSKVKFFITKKTQCKSVFLAKNRNFVK